MSDIKRYPIVRHFRAEPTGHVLRYRKGRLVSSSTGSAFWFRPLKTAIAEVPVDDREQAFLFTGRTADFQDVTVQGTVTYRVTDPELAARRIDFGLDPGTGAYLETPLERLSQMVTQAAQQLALDWIAHRSLHDVLGDAVQGLRPLLSEGLSGDPTLAGVGLQVPTVRVTRVAPTPDLEVALQAPTRERLQQAADEATFQRRALAVEKERAIAENELANQIELAKRRQELIEREGANARKQAQDEAETARIAAEGAAETTKIGAGAHAGSIQIVETARNAAEAERMATLRHLPPEVSLALALRDLAGKLQHIEHLSISPDGLTGLLERLVTAGTRKLES